MPDSSKEDGTFVAVVDDGGLWLRCGPRANRPSLSLSLYVRHRWGDMVAHCGLWQGGQTVRLTCSWVFWCSFYLIWNGMHSFAHTHGQALLLSRWSSLNVRVDHSCFWSGPQTITTDLASLLTQQQLLVVQVWWFANDIGQVIPVLVDASNPPPPISVIRVQ